MPSVFWDWGSAYDLFASLYILHHPGVFGLRPAWAAGVRSRLPHPQRAFLESAYSFLPMPLTWLSQINVQPKNAAAALAALERLAPGERLGALLDAHDTRQEVRPLWQRIRQRKSYDDADLEALRVIYTRQRVTIAPGMLQNVCEAWRAPEEWGEMFLQCLRAYCQVFFFEEEQRIHPVVASSLEGAQELAGQMTLPDLLYTLTGGVTVDMTSTDLILAPSFWAGPLIFYSQVDEGRLMVLYGARTADQPLVPGEDVPSAMLAELKALADPTRLRILRLLREQPLTLSELSRQVHLRPPTVLHHLYALRLAQLVQVSFMENNERRYAYRAEGLGVALEHLKNFLES